MIKLASIFFRAFLQKEPLFFMYVSDAASKVRFQKCRDSSWKRRDLSGSALRIKSTEPDEFALFTGAVLLCLREFIRKPEIEI